MQALSEAIQQSEENVQMILAMCDLDQDAFNNSKDGMEALIQAFVKKYKKDWILRARVCSTQTLNQ